MDLAAPRAQASFEPFSSDPEFVRRGNEINRLLMRPMFSRNSDITKFQSVALALQAASLARAPQIDASSAFAQVKENGNGILTLWTLLGLLGLGLDAQSSPTRKTFAPHSALESALRFSLVQVAAFSTFDLHQAKIDAVETRGTKTPRVAADRYATEAGQGPSITVCKCMLCRCNVKQPVWKSTAALLVMVGASQLRVPSHLPQIGGRSKVASRNRIVPLLAQLESSSSDLVARVQTMRMWCANKHGDKQDTDEWHALEECSEVLLKVWTNWTFAEVREALASKLGREDVRRKARFVFKTGSGSAAWMSFKDDEIVGWLSDGSRRKDLCFLGVSDLRGEEAVQTESKKSLRSTESPLERGREGDSKEKEKAKAAESARGTSLMMTKQLLEEFEKACKQDEFQKALQALHKRGGIALQLGLTQLMSQAADAAARALGLGSEWRLQRVIDSVKEHSIHVPIQILARGVEKQLQLEPGTLFSMPEEGSASTEGTGGVNGGHQHAAEADRADEAKQQISVPAQLQTLPENVEVVVQHAVGKGEVCVTVPGQATMLEVRQAIAIALGKPEVVEEGRLVQRVGRGGGGTFSSYKDDERLNGRRRLLLMGVDLEDDDDLDNSEDDAREDQAIAIRGLLGRNKAKEESSPEKFTPPMRATLLPDVQVTLRHAVDEEQLRDEEVRLTVKSDATMKSVKEALAAHLGRPEILRTCRLVHRVGSAGAFAAFKDSEKINGRRSLLVLGVQSLRAAGDTGDLGGKGKEKALQEEGKQLESQPSRQRASDSKSKVKVEVPLLQLGVAQLLALQKDLLEGFSTADFQARRKELQRTLGKTDLRKFTVERQKLFLTVQSMVLPKYGLPGNPKGVFEMMQQFENPELLMNQEFQQLGSMLNALLFSDDDVEQTKQTVSTKAKQRAADVEVTLRHAVDEEQLRDEEVRLTVKGDASMKSVKEALAVFLGRPEILRTCRLVHRVGSAGVFAAFKDSEKINGRRSLLVLGVQSLRAAGDTGDLGGKGGANALQEEGKQLESLPSRQRASDSKSKVEVPLQLGVAQLLALQKDLLEGFSTADFQARRKELQRTLGKTDLRKFTVERQKLFLTVQSMVLPKYGLPGIPRALNALLFSDDDVEQTKQTVSTKAKQRAADVEVTLRHAVDEEQLRDEEVRLTVKSDASMKSVKEALAVFLGRPEILRTCRLVHRVGSAGVFAAFKDSEKINGRRNLLVLGVQSLRAAGDTGDFGGERGADALQEEGKQLESLPSRQRSSASSSKVEVPLQLGVAQLLSLQKDLLEGFSTSDFQARRRELQRTLQKTDLRKFTVERQKLFLTVQSMVLPKYGLPGTPKGVFEMMQQFEKPELFMNQEFQKLGSMLNALLFSDDDSEQTEKTVSTKAKQRAVDVEVILRHAVDEEQLRDEEVRLTVKSDATMKFVKEALALFLGRPEILRTCRLVHRVGSAGAFAAFKDSEKLGARRSLLLLGVQSLRPTREPEPEEKAHHSKEPPLLGVEGALALQKGLLEGFSGTDFQVGLKWLQKTFQKADPRKFSIERQKLFLTVQSVVLPKFGFEGNPKGVFEMLQQFDRPGLLLHEDFQRQGQLLNHLLFSEPDDNDTQIQAVDVEVTLRHAVAEEQLRDEEVRLTVKSDTTMKSVKEALVAFLGRSEVLRTCRLVHRVGSSGAFVAFKDSEKLGARRSLLLLGVQSLRPTREPEPEEKAHHSKQPPYLSVEGALALQKGLLEGFSGTDFQVGLKWLQKTFQKADPRKFSIERQKLFLTVQSVVLPKFGFEGNPKGVFEMLQQFDRPELLLHEDFQRQGQLLNHLLSSEPDDNDTQIQVPTSTVPSLAVSLPKEVTVRVHQRAEDGEGHEVCVTVSEAASMRDVRVAVANLLCNEDILAKGQLVRKQASLGVAMRNRGPGKWRDWRWGQIVIPLYPLDVVPPTPDPAAVVLNPIKPLSEVAYQTISALQAKNFLPKLTDALGELVKQPDSPGGRFQEQRLRDCFKDTASALLEPE
ncbi:unnamed protein product, partial [Polarella glacialis]